MERVGNILLSIMSVVAYRTNSYAAGTYSVGSSVAITKPTGLAVNDLMLAFMSAYISAAANPTITAPAGWTQLQTETIIHDSPSGRVTYTSFYKIAEAADVAASSFTFSSAAGADATGIQGSVSRFDGQEYEVVPVNASADGGAGPVSTGSVSISGITPTVQSLLVMLVASANNASAQVPTTSTYAIATSNPSWTEAYDTGTAMNGTGISMAMAHASRPELTATGNASASFDITVEGTYCQIIALSPFINRPATLTASITMLAATIPVVVNGVLSILATIPSVVVDILAPTWKNQQKNSADWENQDKST